MFALGNRPRIRQSPFKLSGDRRRRQETRAAYRTQLRLEPLEDRRLLSVTATWTGLGGNHLWMNPGNWDVAPVAGDNLSFPAGPTETTTFNNFNAGTAFGSIDIAGDNYSLAGNQLVLGGDVTSEGSNNSLGLDLQLAADHSISNANTVGATLTVSGAIDLNNHNLAVSATDSSGITELDGMIQDTSVGDTGGLNVSGNGQSVLTAANSYAGLTEVHTGSTLVVENPQGLGTAAAGTQLDYNATLQLAGSIKVTGEALTAGTYDFVTSVGANVWTGDMTTTSELVVDVTGGNSLEVDGNITGNYLYNNDAGQLTLDGSANAIQYQLYNYGVLEVDGTLGLPYSDLYNYGTLQGTGTINTGATYYQVSNYGTLNPGLTSSSSAPGILNTGSFYESGGNFNVRLNGHLTPGTDYDQLNVTGSVGLGGNLNVTLGYTPSLGDSFVIVNNDGADPISGAFNGLPQGSLLAVGSDFFQISYTGGDGNDVVLTGAAADIWTGADGGPGDWSDGANWLSGHAPNPGDNLIFPNGASQTTNVNDFTGAAAVFGTIQISGDNYSLTGNPVSLAGNVVSMGTGNSLDLDSLQLSANGGISNAAGTTFTVSSPINLAGYNLSLSAASGATELDGAITGAGGLTIGGNGQSILNAANLYTGATTVNSGTLIVENDQGLGAAGTGNGTDVENGATLELEGSVTVTGELLTSGSSVSINSVGANVWTGDMTLASSLNLYIEGGNSLEVDGNITASYLYNNYVGQLTLDGSANAIQYQVYNYGVLEVDGTLGTPSGYVYNYGTLQGTGTINDASNYFYNYGTLKPGLTSSSSAPGILNTGNFYQSGGNFNVRLDGYLAPGTDYDQLNVTGSVSLGGNLNVTLGYAPGPTDSFIIVSNDGADPISGTFAGLPEGSLLAAGPDFFQISYTGGDGNDVVLTSATADVWTGADNGPGGSNDWSDAGNWSNGVPTTGDSLIFPAGAPQTTNVNDLTAGMLFGTIQISGDNYDLTGSAVQLGGNVTSPGTGNTLDLDALTLAADEGIVNANTAGSTFTVSSPINLNGHNLSLSAANSSGITELDNVISGAGGLTIGGNGQVILNAANLYTGVTTVNSGTLVVENASGLGAIGAGNDTNLVDGATLELKNDITVAGELLTSSGLNSEVTLQSVGANVWTGDMTIAYELDVNAAGGNSLEVDGNITGPYLYNSTGSQLILVGSANVLQQEVVNYGILEVDGTLSLPSGYAYNYGTLQGTGTINTGASYQPIYNYGTLIPGTPSVPGILTANFLANYGNFNVLLNGDTTAGTDYAQLDVTGSVNLAGNLNVTLGYTPGPTDAFIIVNNQGSNPINGTFAGLPQGSLLVVGSDVLQISYTGGDGNDVVLSKIAADVWTGASLTSNDWSDGANWLSGSAPNPGDNLVFPAGALQTTNVNDFGSPTSATAFGTIQISGDNYDLTGNPVSLAGNVVSAGAGNTLSLDGLQLSADEGIVNTNTAGSTFTVASPIDLGGHNLSLSATDSSGITELDDAISGAGGLTIGGSGQSILNAANLYTGVTTVNSGTLVVENGQGLGATGTGNGTDVENGATLELEGSIKVTGELLTSTSNVSLGSLGANVWNGDMTVASTLDLYISSGNSLEVDGNITGLYLYDYDAGQLTLDGAANAIQYQVQVYNSAVLEVDGTLSTPSGSVYNYGTLQGTGTINGAGNYVYNYGTLNPGLTSLSSAPGILNTGNFYQSGNLNVRLNGHLIPGTDYDQLNVTGSVSLSGDLNVTLGYAPGPTDSYVILNNDGADPISGAFTGLPQGGLLVVSSDVFQISYTGGDGNDVVLTRVNADVWTGASLLSNDWSDGGNWLGGLAPSPGDNLIFPAGALQTTNVNDFGSPTSATAFGTIQISGDNYSLTGNPISMDGSIISAGTGNTLGIDALTLTADEGIVNTNTAGSTFTVSSPIGLGGHVLSLSAADSSGITELDGAISGAGGLTVGGSGQSILHAANLYTGVTTVNSGTLVVENAQALGATGAGNETDVENGATLELKGPITVTGELLTSTSNAAISSLGASVWTGDMTLSGQLNVNVAAGNSLQVNGNINGNYLYNNDAGQLILDGNFTGYDLYNYGAGSVVLNGSANVVQNYVENYGVLEVDGTLTTVYYSVDNYSNGTLQGTGTIDASTYYNELIYNYGTLSPGTPGVPGVLNASDVYLMSNDSYGNFNVLLNGTTAGTEYSQLNVTGSVTVGGNLNVSLGYTPTIGDTYLIIKNDGTEAVSGTFTGLAKGATVSAGGYNFQISYVGGTGNDVVLTALTGNPDNTPPTATINQAVGQDDPTHDSTIHFTVVFSKVVNGFTASDISFAGSTDAASLTATLSSSDQITFDVAVTGMTNDGPVTIDFAAGAATDGGGLGNLAPSLIDNTVTYDNTPPTVTLSAPSASITAGGPITYTVTYADANFNADTLLATDVTLNKTGTANGTVGVSTLTSTTELVTISGIAGDGTLGITLAADTASDLADNLAPAAGPSATFTVDNTPPSGIGLYNPTTSVFYLRNTTSLQGPSDKGYADETFPYGLAGGDWIPIAGDWTGSGVDTIGLYNPATSVFYLNYSNTSGYASLTFMFGPANSGDIPIAGDWTHQGKDTVGLYNPTTSVFYLKNSNSSGYADVTVMYGAANSGEIPLAGDWTGAGKDTIGLYNATTSVFYLRNSNTSGYADTTIFFGPGGLLAGAQWVPLAGDWTGAGKDTAGLYNPTASVFYLKNSNTSGYADITIAYGRPGGGSTPIAGAWTLSGPGLLAANQVVAAASTPALTQGDLQPIVDAALARWTSAGLNAATVQKLAQVQFVLSDLPGSYLGETAGNRVYIDTNAAGNGWFVDPTPASDEAFASSGSQQPLAAVDPRAVDRIDLLTVVEHELGHVAGLSDLHAVTDDIMNGVLGAGVRRDPNHADAVLALL